MWLYGSTLIKSSFHTVRKNNLFIDLFTDEIPADQKLRFIKKIEILSANVPFNITIDTQ